MYVSVIHTLSTDVRIRVIWHDKGMLTCGLTLCYIQGHLRIYWYVINTNLTTITVISFVIAIGALVFSFCNQMLTHFFDDRACVHFKEAIKGTWFVPNLSKIAKKITCCRIISTNAHQKSLMHFDYWSYRL